MPKVFFGKKNEPGFDLKVSDELIAVRTRSGRSIARTQGAVAGAAMAALDDGSLLLSYPEASVEIYQVPVGRGRMSLSDRKRALRSAPDVRFAGGVLVDPATKAPVLYTENVFIKFADETDPDDCLAMIRDAGLLVKETLSYADNAYFLGAPEGSGQTVFELANRLLQLPDVEYCHPELIRPRARKGIFAQQWHLKKTTINGVTIDAHANVEDAHQLSRGANTTIAIIDDGVDIEHPEFRGSGKIVAPRDATLLTDDPRPKDPYGTGVEHGENHGTACAGVACANGSVGASGVAPEARLMPIRLASGLGSQREANAFKWAADNGADIISCSWGPDDGPWYKPNHPDHKRVFPLPASTRLAIDYATTHGRGGKGCVVLFAAGNGNESVDNDGYASYANVIAVAACNDRGSRSVYSDFGKAVWCAFPSDDAGLAEVGHPEPLTPGIWTTDRSKRSGYNTGRGAAGDEEGLFTNSFGGTSSSCPGAAGVAALMLSINPELRWREVREIFKQACDKIDPQGGKYDRSGHSHWYGYGRLNARKAVELAKPAPQSALTVSRRYDALIPDRQTVAFSLAVAEDAVLEELAVSVDLKHSYIGDLIITLIPPAALRARSIVLHNRAGGSRNALARRFDELNTPALAALAGKRCRGSWTLQIRDAAAEDAGTLHSFALHLRFAHPERTVRRASAQLTEAAPAKRKRRSASKRS